MQAWRAESESEQKFIEGKSKRGSLSTSRSAKRAKAV